MINMTGFNRTNVLNTYPSAKEKQTLGAFVKLFTLLTRADGELSELLAHVQAYAAYAKLEKDTLAILIRWDTEDGAEEMSAPAEARDFLKYYVAKADKLLLYQYDEYNTVKSATYNIQAGRIVDEARNTAFVELERLVKGSLYARSSLKKGLPASGRFAMAGRSWELSAGSLAMRSSK